MIKPLDIAMIGIDSSHAVEFTRLMQSPQCPPGAMVEGMRVKTCMAFKTPFTDDDVIAERTGILKGWGVNVVDSLAGALEGCDAIIIAINDPSLHLEYTEKCAAAGKPLFLDKPMADTVEHGKKIVALATENSCRIFTSSSLRFAPAFVRASQAVRVPLSCYMYGALGRAKAGSSIIWYGVHAFEMLQAALGLGAKQVTVRKDRLGAVAHVEYADMRRGIVELTRGVYNYGGIIRSRDHVVPFAVDGTSLYHAQLKKIKRFFDGAPAPISLAEDSMEVMALLEAADRSLESGSTVPVPEYR